MKSPKLAPGSILTLADQTRLYRDLMGEERTREQIRLARLERGQCICDPQSVKRRWEGSDKLTTRRIHAKSCPRRRPWMDEDGR